MPADARLSLNLKPYACAQGYQLGQTKVFLRAGQMAVLDKLRTELMNRSAVTIQRHMLGFIARKQYARTRCAAITLQASRCGLHSDQISCELRRGSEGPGSARLQVLMCTWALLAPCGLVANRVTAWQMWFTASCFLSSRQAEEVTKLRRCAGGRAGHGSTVRGAQAAAHARGDGGAVRAAHAPGAEAVPADAARDRRHPGRLPGSPRPPVHEGHQVRPRPAVVLAFWRRIVQRPAEAAGLGPGFGYSAPSQLCVSPYGVNSSWGERSQC